MLCTHKAPDSMISALAPTLATLLAGGRSLDSTEQISLSRPTERREVQFLLNAAPNPNYGAKGQGVTIPVATASVEWLSPLRALSGIWRELCCIGDALTLGPQHPSPASISIQEWAFKRSVPGMFPRRLEIIWLPHCYPNL